MRNLFSLLATVSLAAMLASPSFAFDGPRPPDDPHRPMRAPAPMQVRHWHGDIYRFHDYDFNHWRGGRWFHGPHDGRFGWWWVASGYWYSYPSPVYPYPDPYVPSGAVVEVVPSGSAAYYYCDNPAGYYPYVPQCFAPWKRVVSQASSPIVAMPPAPVETPSENTRDTDYRQLNTFADEFYHIDLKASKALANLRNLDTRLEAFRKGLLNRDYNAMDVVRDTEDLKDKIAVQKRLASKRSP